MIVLIPDLCTITYFHRRQNFLIEDNVVNQGLNTVDDAGPP